MKYRLMDRPHRFLLPLILLAYTACHKPAHIDSQSMEDEFAPRVYSVTIGDTLPESYISEVGVEKNTKGLQFDHHDRQINTYFTYSASKGTVLSALSKLGFSRYAMRADTTCRELQPKEFLSMRDHMVGTEGNESDFFWNVDIDNFNIYECLKSPARHLVLIEKNSTKVLHFIQA